MNSQRVRVAVNGYGVVGKRVADAIRLQPDMNLVGVSDIVTDYRLVGTLDDLLLRVDVVADCTPKGIAAQNLERYRRRLNRSA